MDPSSPSLQDQQHLDLLGVFHYVVAALMALFSLFPLIHLVLGVAMVTGKLEPNDPGAAIVGWFFVVFAGAFILCGFTMAVLTALAGRYLRQRRRYTFCLVVAAIECLFMPFGTVLGVFTLIVLARNGVRDGFSRA
ncbi:MAG TPA: hypothetical protein VGD21_12780 [Lysobacter sp.]